MKNIKKITLFLLTFALILTSAIVPMTVSAEGTTPIGYSASLVTTSVLDSAKSITQYYADYTSAGAAPTSGSYTMDS